MQAAFGVSALGPAGGSQEARGEWTIVAVVMDGTRSAGGPSGTDVEPTAEDVEARSAADPDIAGLRAELRAGFAAMRADFLLFETKCARRFASLKLALAIQGVAIAMFIALLKLTL